MALWINFLMDIGSCGRRECIQEEYSSKSKMLATLPSSRQACQRSFGGRTKLDLWLLMRKRDPHRGTVRYFTKMMLE